MTQSNENKKQSLKSRISTIIARCIWYGRKNNMRRISPRVIRKWWKAGIKFLRIQFFACIFISLFFFLIFFCCWKCLIKNGQDSIKKAVFIFLNQDVQNTCYKVLKVTLLLRAYTKNNVQVNTHVVNKVKTAVHFGQKVLPKYYSRGMSVQPQEWYT